MASKRKRKARAGSGIRKNRAGKNCSRKGPAIADQAESNFLRHQAASRWPTDWSLDKMAEMAMDKKPRSRQKSKPMTLGFSVLDHLIDKPGLDKLLTAASLKIKRIRRYPGYVLMKTYNLKNRPIQII